MKLEGAPPPAALGENGYVQNDEEELRNWADLREFQNRFATSGGFLNDI